MNRDRGSGSSRPDTSRGADHAAKAERANANCRTHEEEPCLDNGDLIQVSTPIFQLRPRVVKAHEPMRVQTFGAKLAVERFDKAVVGRLAGPREVENHTALIGPQIEIARDELRALVNTDALGIPADLAGRVRILAG